LLVSECVRPFEPSHWCWKSCAVLDVWRIIAVWQLRYVDGSTFRPKSILSLRTGLAIYDGTSFAAYEDVIVVTANYRTNSRELAKK
jgi:hypothetical protein